MLIVGIVLIPAFLLYEFKVARYPVIARRFVFNRSVVIASLISSLDFVGLFTMSTVAEIGSQDTLSGIILPHIYLSLFFRRCG